MAYTLKYHSVIKKDPILPFVTWMDLEGVKSAGEKQILYDLTYIRTVKTPPPPPPPPIKPSS